MSAAVRNTVGAPQRLRAIPGQGLKQSLGRDVINHCFLQADPLRLLLNPLEEISRLLQVV
jgi:hypothetical protein